jgi:AraC-like DNA-binding protein
MPTLPIVPLASHRVFTASSVEEIEAAVARHLGAVCVEAPAERSVSAVANCYQMPSGQLWFCSYDAPVVLEFGDSDYFRIQFHRTGTGSTRIGSRTVPVVPGQGCISRAAVRLSFGAGYQQLVWRIDGSVMAGKLAAITGMPAPRALEFEPALDLTFPRAGALLGVVHSAVHCISGSAEPSRFLLTELEQALMVALLVQNQHNGGAQLGWSGAAEAAPWQVRRVEEYIEAHLDKPFTIEEATALTGGSARSIYRAFQRYRGYSPSEFSKRRRLQRARVLLTDPSLLISITSVAYDCGFSDLSHFSRDFRAAFGETPRAAQQSARRQVPMRPRPKRRGAS